MFPAKIKDGAVQRISYTAAVPIIHPTAFIHSAAIVSGNVTVDARVSVWPAAVVRGDSEAIAIGEDSNIQDGTVVHADAGFPTRIGKRVGVGHRAIIHGAQVDDDCLIGMGAILLNGTRIGTGSIVAAGAVCPEGFEVPANFLAVGVPARLLRPTTDAERDRIRHTVEAYLQLQVEHRAGKYPQFTHLT